MRRIVLPGEKIADRPVRIPNTFIEGDATYAAVVGMLDEDGAYIPLETRYKPAVNDIMIGIIIDIKPIGYALDINLPSNGLLRSRAIRIQLDTGDIIAGTVEGVNEVGDVEFSEVRKLPKGKVVEFPTAKIPRLIGRKNSMLNILREGAGGDIIIGNNGYVWISENANIQLVLKAMNIVKKKAHLSGLTDEITAFIQKEKGAGRSYQKTDDSKEGML